MREECRREEDKGSYQPPGNWETWVLAPPPGNWERTLPITNHPGWGNPGPTNYLAVAARRIGDVVVRNPGSEQIAPVMAFLGRCCCCCIIVIIVFIAVVVVAGQ